MCSSMGSFELKKVLNTCKSASYTKISDLREDCPYRIVKFERVTTAYGETIMVTLEGHVGDDFYIRVYLPRRYKDVFSDRTIEQYNAGMGDRIQLVKRSPQPGSNTTPLEFV